MGLVSRWSAPLCRPPVRAGIRVLGMNNMISWELVGQIRFSICQIFKRICRLDEYSGRKRRRRSGKVPIVLLECNKNLSAPWGELGSKLAGQGVLHIERLWKFLSSACVRRRIIASRYVPGSSFWRFVSNAE